MINAAARFQAATQLVIASGGGGTVTLDSSTPAIANSGYLGTASGSQASNSFAPSGGSVVVVTAWAGMSYLGSPTAVATITDSLGTHLIWTKVKEQNNSSDYGDVAVWWAYAGASSPGAMTATVTMHSPSGQSIGYMSVAVKVFDGALTSGPIGTVIYGTASGSPLSQALSPSVSGSVLFLAAINGHASYNSAWTLSAGSGCYMTDTAATSYGAWGQVDYGTSGGPTDTTGSSETLSMSVATDTGSVWQYIGFEVIP